MKKIRYGLIVMSMLLCWVTSAAAQVSISIGLPTVSIGINLPLFPHLVRVPGYPVYYAPQMEANYFFYDGMYWVYQDDNWYTSTWYNGPWYMVAPEVVPLFILRVPVRYYRQPPMYFREWHSNAPPRWGQHWGHGWEQNRRGWNRWKRSSAPAPAPLPVYQRRYSGDRYPTRVEQQHKLRSKSYRYQPRDKVVRQIIKQQAPPSARREPVPAKRRVQEPAQRRVQEAPPVRRQQQEDFKRPAPHQQVAPPSPRTQQHQGGENIRKPAQPPKPAPQQRAPAVREQRQQHTPPAVQSPRPQPGAAQHEQNVPRVKEHKQKKQDMDDLKEENRGRGRGQQNDDKGRGRDR